ncbi:hypothetical protein ACIOWI_30175 [Streptomyces sp. NPDC087659]|uniref:hypothetical protein n=1 Tax=Streptomyces sp. NPDC087659 TaxID=3365801 RepID=UPI003819515B
MDIIDVPAWPLYKLTADQDGTVTISGPAAPKYTFPNRASAVDAVAQLAAVLRPPRPVRAEAVDADGTAWPVTIDPDGTVTETGRPTKPRKKDRKARTEEAAPPRADRPPTEERPVLSGVQQLLVQAQARQQQHLVPAPRAEPPSAAPIQDDPHRAISEASQAGRHREAAAIAAACEQAALRSHGPASAEVAHWLEVRAFLALQEGAAHRACQLWLQGAVVRLSATQPPDHPEVVEAVDRAHHAWHLVTEPDKARELGTQLLNIRTRITGKSGALTDVQRRLAKLSEGSTTPQSRGS